MTFLESRELAASLEQQKRIELRPISELAVGVIAREHAAAERGEISTEAARRRGLMAAALVLLITVVASVFMARRITGPLRRMTAAMKSLRAA